MFAFWVVCSLASPFLFPKWARRPGLIWGNALGLTSAYLALCKGRLLPSLLMPPPDLAAPLVASVFRVFFPLYVLFAVVLANSSQLGLFSWIVPRSFAEKAWFRAFDTAVEFPTYCSSRLHAALLTVKQRQARGDDASAIEAPSGGTATAVGGVAAQGAGAGVSSGSGSSSGVAESDSAAAAASAAATDQNGVWMRRLAMVRSAKARQQQQQGQQGQTQASTGGVQQSLPSPRAGTGSSAQG